MEIVFLLTGSVFVVSVLLIGIALYLRKLRLLALFKPVPTPYGARVDDTTAKKSDSPIQYKKPELPPMVRSK